MASRRGQVDLLRELYTDKPPREDLRAAEVARA